MSALPCRGPLRAATRSRAVPPDRTLTIAAPARSPLPLEPRLTHYGRVSSRASAASYRNSAAMSERTNDRTGNIGARRLHTVMERLLDEISFDAPEMGGVANASQIATVNKQDLDALAGTVPPRVLDRVNEGLRWFLGLDA